MWFRNYTEQLKSVYKLNLVTSMVQPTISKRLPSKNIVQVLYRGVRLCVPSTLGEGNESSKIVFFFVAALFC